VGQGENQGMMANLFTLIALLGCLTPVFSEASPRPYSLGVVLVVDQFRADYLMRFEEKFLPAKANGYKAIMQKGAYFPLADHGLFQDMTGPGHAAILSGAYPYRHHISINWFFDRETKKDTYCVQDDRVKIIGSDGVVSSAKYGASPRNFNATTVGDELKNIDRPSRVVSVAIKDRAAILLGGKRADDVFWFDEKTCQWVTSDFYKSSLPEFVKKQNAMIKPLIKEKFSWGPYQNIHYCTKDSIRTPWAIGETFKLALATVDEMKLGKGKDTDLLLISLSSHDYLGHQIGPNDQHMESMTLEEDKLIADFLNKLAKKLPKGLDDVFVVLTGDHGTPPHPKHLPIERLPSENIPEDLVPKIIEDALNTDFGKPKEGKWLLAFTEFQAYFNPMALEGAKVTMSQVVEAARKRLIKEHYIDEVWSRDEIMRERKVPAGEYGVVLDRTLSFRSGDMLIQLKPFFYSDSYPLTHMTMYSYDRYVPLAFWGKTFKPGTYRQIVNIVDIAPTLSSVLGVLPPAQSEGRVLNEILR
jgi:predicted AlkP superfamily pyrophosphatase or phosphodiesterase